MATLYITELALLSGDQNMGPIMAPYAPSIIAEQTVGISGVSAPCNPFQPATRFIMVNTDTACYLAFNKGLGSQPPVVPGPQHRLGPNETRFYGVAAGEQLAVLVGV